MLIRLSGRSPAAIYALLLRGTWGNAYGIGQVLFKATPLLFTGLSVSLALRAGLFNVGAEGQITVGAFLCALVGATMTAAMPRAHSPARIVPLCLFMIVFPFALQSGFDRASWRGKCMPSD